MNIDTATDLGFDEDGSSADRERYKYTLHIELEIHSVKKMTFCIGKKVSYAHQGCIYLLRNTEKVMM